MGPLYAGVVALLFHCVALLWDHFPILGVSPWVPIVQALRAFRWAGLCSVGRGLCLIGRWFGCLVGWLAGWLAGWMMVGWWLAGLLFGWLADSFWYLF